jgi:hypothetical protein
MGTYYKESLIDHLIYVLIISQSPYIQKERERERERIQKHW